MLVCLSYGTFLNDKDYFMLDQSNKRILTNVHDNFRLDQSKISILTNVPFSKEFSILLTTSKGLLHKIFITTEKGFVISRFPV